MDNYIEQIKQYCQENGIDGQEVIEKVQKRYKLGLEAGMSDEDIIEMIGDYKDMFKPKEEIIKKSEDDDDQFDFDLLDIVLVGNVDLTIKSAYNDEIKVDMNDDIVDDYEFKVEDGKILLHPKKQIHNYNIIDGYIDLYLPNNLTYQKVNLTNVNSDVDSKNYGFVCHDCYLSTVNGDMDFVYIKSNSFTLETVSGDVEIKNLFTKNSNVETVNGDITVCDGKTDNLSVSSVNGDIAFGGVVETIDTSTVNGDITVNNKTVSQSISEKIKNCIKIKINKNK